MARDTRSTSVRSAVAWALALVAIFALRLPHMVGPLDDPHSWRQCDTVNYTWNFYRHGIDLLHPAVCWLGGYRTLIFEFALPEAMAAVLDRVFGYTPVWDRVVALVFTALSAAWLYGIARELSDRFTARVATAIYLLAPLAQFFSRAPQVDFAAQAFAHGLLYHGLRSARRGGAAHVAAAAACGVLAALIKGPYLAPVMPVLGLAMLAAGSLAEGAGIAIAVAASTVAFVAWRGVVNTVNGAAPDWFFLAGYYKEVNPWWWYIGSLHQRLEPAGWIKIARRLLFEIATPAGAVLAVCAVAASAPRDARGPSPRLAAFAWLAGAVAYMLVFFPLNVMHDYYQIPFIAPIALLAALGLRALTRTGAALPARALGWLAFAVLVAMALVWPRRLEYYRVDHLRVEAGRALSARVPEEDLVIVVDHASEYSDPRFLVRALRDGWAVKPEEVTPTLLAHLQPLGARWLAWVAEPGNDRLRPPGFLAAREVAAVPLVSARERRKGGGVDSLGVLHVYRLASGGNSQGGRP